MLLLDPLIAGRLADGRRAELEAAVRRHRLARSARLPRKLWRRRRLPSNPPVPHGAAAAVASPAGR